MLSLTWARGAIGRRLGRSVAEAIGIAIAVALVVAIGSFLGVAKRTMTTRSVEHVAVDWQVEAQPGADPTAALDTVRSQPRVAYALPADFASTSGMSATTGTTTQTTGAGVAVGVPADYAQRFPGEMRLLTGSGTGALLAQQAASNLHATPGTVVVISRPGLADVPITIAGVVELPQADSLFQKVGAPPQSQPQAPPDNVVLLPIEQWHALFDPVAAARPDLVHSQVHARLDRHIPNDPAAAFDAVTGAARNLEVRSAGSVIVGDNIGAALDAARQDALYAQVLFVFLGLPGAALAVLIASTIAASGNDRRRADARVAPSARCHGRDRHVVGHDRGRVHRRGRVDRGRGDRKHRRKFLLVHLERDRHRRRHIDCGGDDRWTTVARRPRRQRGGRAHAS